MSSLIVEVCKIEELNPIPNADKIESAKIKGWYCITQKGQYNVGDLVIFIPPDSCLPANLIEEYKLDYLKNGNRVRALKLRGFVSQGLILPNKNNWEEGKEVSKELGITKWEPPIDNGGSLGSKNPVKKRQLNANFDKYTDLENIRNYNKLFKEGEQVVIYEKIHGSNWRCGHIKKNVRKHWFWGIVDKINAKIFGEYEMVYGSHNVQLRWGQYRGPKEGFYKENVYERVAKKYNLPHCLPKDTIVYGEVYGASIQDLSYGLEGTDIDLVVFDVKRNGKYLSFQDLVFFCKAYNLPEAPFLYNGPYSEEIVKDLTKGDSILAQKHGKKQIREGIVIRPYLEDNYPSLGRKILKSISEDYVTRKGGTENH